MPARVLPEKPCATCGRPFAWRRRWSRCWDGMRYCSAACRKRRNDRADAAVEQAILELLQQRRAGATVCPSEVARALWPDMWRPQMQRVRDAARRLAARGAVRVLQSGRAVDAATARGPIRLGPP